MMSIEDYAQDVGKTVEEIYSLCDKLGIAYKDSNTMLDDTAIILLDNKIQEEDNEPEISLPEDAYEEELYEDENFLRDYDDDFDSTYATYEFKVPDKWKSDFDKIIDGKMSEVSKEYVSYLKEFYPKLAEQGVFDRFFSNEENAE